VQVLNENDYIKVKPKAWLDKRDWHEVHDILEYYRALTSCLMIRI
jgi:hypothetical protein